jgi:hypothetical protein
MLAKQGRPICCSRVKSCRFKAAWPPRERHGDAGDDAMRALALAASAVQFKRSEGFHQTWVLLPSTKSVRREGKLAYMSMDFDMGAWVLEDDANAPTTRPMSAVGRSDDMLHTRIKALEACRKKTFQKTLKNEKKYNLQCRSYPLNFCI